MPDLSCPVCSTTGEPAATIGTLAICGSCGASLVVDEAGVRRATGPDTLMLSPAELKTLQTARGRIARPERRQR